MLKARRFFFVVLVFDGEQVVFTNESIESGLGDLVGAEQPLFDAKAIQSQLVITFVVEVRFGGVDGFEQFLGSDFAGLSLVLARAVGHAGDAVVFVAVVPGLNGSPSELARVALLVEKGQGGDLVDPLVPGSALDRVDGSQDSHLQIDRRLLHGVLLTWGIVDRKKRCPTSDHIKKRQLVLSPIFDRIGSAKRDRNSVTIGVDRGRWEARALAPRDAGRHRKRHRPEIPTKPCQRVP